MNLAFIPANSPPKFEEMCALLMYYVDNEIWKQFVFNTPGPPRYSWSIDKADPEVDASIARKPGEQRVRPGHELGWRRALLHRSLAHDEDEVVADDGVDAVGDGEDGALGKVPGNGRLHACIRVRIHGHRRLVQHQDAQQGPRQTQQMALAQRQVASSFCHCMCQAACQRRHASARLANRQQEF